MKERTNPRTALPFPSPPPLPPVPHLIPLNIYMHAGTQYTCVRTHTRIRTRMDARTDAFPFCWPPTCWIPLLMNIWVHIEILTGSPKGPMTMSTTSEHSRSSSEDSEVVALGAIRTSAPREDAQGEGKQRERRVQFDCLPLWPPSTRRRVRESEGAALNSPYPRDRIIAALNLEPWQPHQMLRGLRPRPTRATQPARPVPRGDAASTDTPGATSSAAQPAIAPTSCDAASTVTNLGLIPGGAAEPAAGPLIATQDIDWPFLANLCPNGATGDASSGRSGCVSQPASSEGPRTRLHVLPRRPHTPTESRHGSWKA